MQLRNAMFDLLAYINNNDDYYPRRTFDDHQDFMACLKARIILPQQTLPNSDITGSVDDYVATMKPYGRPSHGQDALLAAILLQRPVVIVENPFHGPTVMEIYFPYGLKIVCLI